MLGPAREQDYMYFVLNMCRSHLPAFPRPLKGGVLWQRTRANSNCSHLFRVDRINNGCLLCGFINEQVHIVVGEGREELDGHVTELLRRATGVLLGHAAQQGTVNREKQSSRRFTSQSSCCNQGRRCIPEYLYSPFILKLNLPDCFALESMY